MSEKGIEKWEDGAFSRILLVTLKEGQGQGQGQSIFELKSTRQELIDGGEIGELYITKDRLEQVIVERLEAGGFGSGSFKYLLDSWKRAVEIYNNLNGSRGRNLAVELRAQRLSSLDALKELLISYSGMEIMYGQMFEDPSGSGGEYKAQEVLVNELEREDQEDLMNRYMEEVGRRFEGEELVEFMDKVMEELNKRVMRNKEIIEGKFWTQVKVMERLVSNKAIATAITQVDWFVMKQDKWQGRGNIGKEVEETTLLGPLFSISGYFEEGTEVKEYYFGMENQGKEDLISSMTNIRNRVMLVQEAQYRIVNMMVRAGKTARDRVVRWAIEAVGGNVKRSGMRVDKREVAGDGFADNLAVVFMKLSEPFTSDVMLRKVDKAVLDEWIAVRVGMWQEICEETKQKFRELTRIRADSEQTDRFERQCANQEIGFIADSFYIASLALHIGPLATMSRYEMVNRNVREVKEEIERLEQQQQQEQQQPMNMQQFGVQRLKMHYKYLCGNRVGMETQLCDRNKLSMALAFMRFQLKAVLQVFSASVESKNQGQGQDQDQEGKFRFLPEFLVEDPSSLILFAARYAPDVLLSPELMPPAPAPSLLGDLYIDLVSLGLNNPESIRNPHLKSKLVDVVHALTYCDPEDDTDYVDTNIAKLQPRFMVHPVVEQFMMSLMSARRAKQLVGALLRLYVDVEHTESTSSFYDKFNTRYNIARILRSLWKQPQSHYLDETIEFFTLNPSKNSHASILVVERFVSRLTSDTTYLLDESLSKLSTIKSIEQDPNYINQNNNNNDNDNNDNSNDNNASDATSQLLSAERQASIYITLAHETVHILAFLACKVPDPFRAEELVLRLAAMLNYNLDVLAGPKCNDLKVKNMYDRFRFNPRLLLSELLSVYTSLSTPFPQINHENLESLESSPPYLFLSALAQDSRSWSSSIFYKAIDLCSKYSLKPYSSLQQLARIGTTVNDLVLQFTDLDELTSGADGNGQDADVPEEFLDPLMYTLMTDPVMLPTSNMVVDRKTIKAYLLNDPRDPFNRMPLDYCDVVEIPDLKRRIVEFRQLQREKLKNRKREA